MTWPRYPQYRQSEVEWLGVVPSHWQIRKFRHCFSESPEKIEAEAIGVMLSVSGYRGIEVKEYDDENRRRLDEELVGYRVVRPGQLVVNTMWLNYAGLGVSDLEGHVSPAYRSYWIAAQFEKRFVHHMMRSEAFVRGYTKFLTGIRPNSLQMSRDDLMSFQVLCPPIDEQVAIATFLDREAAKIDALIAEQEKLIALLAEKRQATISHAVTRGLDPETPLKNSGVSWIGEVPAHWRVSALGYLASLETGSTPDRNRAEYWNGSIPWVKTGEVNWTPIRGAEEHITEDGLANSAAKIARPGTVLMAMYGQGVTRGRVAVLEIEAAYNQACVAIHFSPAVIPEFGRFFFMAAYERIRHVGNETSQMNLSSGLIAKIKLPVPSLDEQARVVSFLDTHTARLDALESAANQVIDLLRERRAALITAAVTGQIDVRNAVARETHTTEDAPA